MSGKKRSEVQSVLKNADETRKDIFEKKFNDLAIAQKNFTELQSELCSYSINIDDEIYNINTVKSKVKKLDKEIKILEQIIPQKAKNFESWSVEDFDDEYFRAEQIINQYEEILNQTYLIEQNINSKRDELLAEKELRERALEQQKFINNKISSIAYQNPLDCEVILNFRQLCADFLDDIEIYNEIITLQEEIKLKIDSQKYEQAINSINLLDNKVITLDKQLQSNIIKIKENLQTAFAIEDILDQSGYEFESELINGKITNGIKIKTINNDDFELNLTNIIVHNEEKIDIDFIVNDTKEGCKIKALELQNRLYKNGIAFKIIDWGTAVNSKVTTPKKNHLYQGKSHMKGES